MEKKESTNEETVVSVNEKSEKTVSRLKKLKWFCIRQYLPISLLFFLFVGIVLPQPGHALDLKVIKYIVVVYKFVYCGLYLRVGELKEALLAYKSLIWGVSSILGITSVIGGLLTGLFINSNVEIPNGGNITNVTTHIAATDSMLDVLGPIELRYGLLIYLIMPCTISTGIVMVNQLNGHFALAILLTVITNLSSVFTIPFFMKWLLAGSSTVKFDILAMLFKLSMTVLLPISAAKGLGFVKPVRKFLDVPSHNLVLRLINLTCISFIVWLKVSTTSYEGKLSQLTAVSIMFVLAWALATHVLFLIINTAATFILKLDKKQRKCIVVLASQKTLTIGVSVLIFLPKSFGDLGFSAIAMVISHICVLIFDSFMIQIWLSYDSRQEKLAKLNEQELVCQPILIK